MKPLTRQALILLEMTTLEISNSGNYSDLKSHLTTDFLGRTTDGIEYTLSKEFEQIYTKNNVVVTKETFQIEHPEPNTYIISYLVFSDYLNKIVRYTST